MRELTDQWSITGIAMQEFLSKAHWSPAKHYTPREDWPVKTSEMLQGILMSSYCLLGTTYTLPNITNALKCPVQQKIFSHVCVSKVSSHKTAPRKASHVTTESPKNQKFSLQNVIAMGRKLSKSQENKLVCEALEINQSMDQWINESIKSLL